jgi:hypothetical protein
MTYELFNRGLDVVGVPRNIANHHKYQYKLPTKFHAIPVTASPMGSKENVFIASETVPEAAIAIAREKKLRVIWWQLAPFNLLGGRVYPEKGEVIMPFSSYTDPSSDFFFYFQPPLEMEWEGGIKTSSRSYKDSKLKLMLYSGKGRIKSLPAQLLNACSGAQIHLITRFKPDTRRQLFKIIDECHGLITFDELTNLNLEAASMGLPVYLANPIFPQKCRDNFIINRLSNHVTTNSDTFLELMHQRVLGNTSAINAESLTCYNIKTIEAIRDIIINKDLQDLRQATLDDILNHKEYTLLLKKKRIIYPQLGGQAGGSLLFKSYGKSVSKGEISNTLLSSIRFLDSIFCYLEFPLVPAANFVKRVNKFLLKQLQTTHKQSSSSRDGFCYVNGREAIIKSQESTPMLN